MTCLLFYVLYGENCHHAEFEGEAILLLRRRCSIFKFNNYIV